MEKFIIRRFITLLFILVGVSFITYGLMFLAPGDPARLVLEAQGIQPTDEQIHEFREAHGMNDPFLVQYVRWAGNVLQGDLGNSYYDLRGGKGTSDDVSALIWERLPNTIELAVAAMIVGLIIAFPTGIISAVCQGQLPDYLSQIASLVGLSIPNFWLGYLLIMALAVPFEAFPVAGAGGFSYLVLPALTLGTGLAAINTRLLRASMLEVLNEEYIGTARSKGLPERIVIYKHALRNALIPILTIVGIQFGFLLNGAIIVEIVFQRPGIGELLITALLNRDYPVVQGLVLLIAVIFVVTNFFIDILYRYIDPRITLEGRQL